MRKGRRTPPVASTHFVIARKPGPTTEDVDAAALLMAIPKRLLRRAIDRNTVRRIAREAWRGRHGARAPASGPVLLRLLRRPAGFENMTQRARKRLWRQELDALFAAHDDA